MKYHILFFVVLFAVLGEVRTARGDFFVVKKFSGGSQQTTTVPDGVPFTVQVSGTVVSVTIFSNALNPNTEDLGRVTIERTTPGVYQQIWIYIVVASNPTPGNTHYLLSQAACRHWNGIQGSDTGAGGLLVRAVIGGNLTDLVHARDGQAVGGVQNLLAGGNVGGAIDSGSGGVCRVRAIGSVAGTAPNQPIQSAVGIAEVWAENGDIRANLYALNGSIDLVSAPNGNIGTLPPSAVAHQINATAGIGSLTAGGSISANITAGGSIGAFDAGTDYRGTMSLSGFNTFHIGRDLLGAGIVNFGTNLLPADRILEIDRSTLSPSQIILPGVGPARADRHQP